MKIFQEVTIGGKTRRINGTFRLKNAITAYNFFRQLSGRQTVAEQEGDVMQQLNILQANNPNAYFAIDMLKYIYTDLLPVLKQMEDETVMYHFSEN